VGDANADRLAYGLEDAFSEKPEFGIVRKHRGESGLIHYGGGGDSEWPQVAREIIAAEKPKFIVMMIGNNDHQQIREKAPPAVRPGAPKANAQQAQPAIASHPIDAEQQRLEPPANLTPEQARQAAYGPWEFHTEKWELAYIRRVDATIAALKSAGVPVLWVGLASQRGTKASADSSYLNEIYRSRAEKADITYVDIWDGFVDEAGRYSPQGPDYEGQIRRLRAGDGVHFTKFGARKLAHYVEREIERNIANRGIPVALPVPVNPGSPAPNAKPGGPAQRPVAGPVVPLNVIIAEGDELLGAAHAPATDPATTRVLTKGEPIAGPNGRADDFSWPRGNSAEPAAEQRIPTTDGHGSETNQPAPTAEQEPQVQRRVRSSTGQPRPRLPIWELFGRLINWN
jgi:lysophospholipase L1-like esterase